MRMILLLLSSLSLSTLAFTCPSPSLSIFPLASVLVLALMLVLVLTLTLYDEAKYRCGEPGRPEEHLFVAVMASYNLSFTSFRFRRFVSFFLCCGNKFFWCFGSGGDVDEGVDEGGDDLDGELKLELEMVVVCIVVVCFMWGVGSECGLWTADCHSFTFAKNMRVFESCAA